MFGLDASMLMLLGICLIAVCLFEFINGFHDTANAVAGVIYTKSMKPKLAVLMAGFMNFVGVYIGGIAVAMGVINLLPSEMLNNVTSGSVRGISMILAILITAIVWNLGTWYLSLPCSSSHTLIGSIIGAGWAFSFLPEGAHASVNWSKAIDVGLSLLISPICGFLICFLFIKLLQKTIKSPNFFKSPEEVKRPNFWTRATLITTAAGVSVAHGSNDGQKGVGLMMLILLGILPAQFALEKTDNADKLHNDVITMQSDINKIDITQQSAETQKKLGEAKEKIEKLYPILVVAESLKVIPEEKRFEIRKTLTSVNKVVEKGLKEGHIKVDAPLATSLKNDVKTLKSYYEFAPFWVLVLISLSLGIGTMFGWKRIVKTVGEKIGKGHFSAAHGTSTSLVSALTIGASTGLGLPVSTTHIVSSGVAGSMAGSGGHMNLQGKTIRNILIAWVLTLPVCIGLSAGLLLAFNIALK